MIPSLPHPAAVAARWLGVVACVAHGLAASGAAPVAEPPADAAATTRLEYRFQPGERIVMDVAHRALTETTIGGSKQSVETATDSTKIWSVVSVDDEGRATIEHSVDDVTMTSRTSDVGEVRWSSRGGEDPPPGSSLKK